MTGEAQAGAAQPWRLGGMVTAPPQRDGETTATQQQHDGEAMATQRRWRRSGDGDAAATASQHSAAAQQQRDGDATAAQRQHDGDVTATQRRRRRSTQRGSAAAARGSGGGDLAVATPHSRTLTTGKFISTPNARAPPRHTAPQRQLAALSRGCASFIRQVSDARHDPPEVAGHRARRIEPAATTCPAAREP